jgi:hypothetical protein
MCPPFVKMTCWTRFGIGSTSVGQMFFTPLPWNTLPCVLQLNNPFCPGVSSACSINFRLGSCLENYQDNWACWFCFLEWTSWLPLSCGTGQDRVEMSLYHLHFFKKLSSAKVCRNSTTLLLSISMHFDIFIMPSTETRPPGPLALRKSQNIFLESILQSAENAPLSLVHHCFMWQHLFCNLEQEMWFINESHLLPAMSSPQSILYLPKPTVSAS